VTIAVTQVSPATPAKTFTINVIDVFENQPPVITSSASVTVAENQQLAFALTATDEVGVTWSIVGGADMAHFQITGSTLQWTGNGTKDFEAPGSSLGTNAYVVRVRATDPGALFVEQNITVNVTDVLENVDRVRLDQQYVEVVSAGYGKVRLDQQYAEVVESGTNNRVRLDQQYVETINSGNANKVRLAQQYIEVITN